MEVANDLSGYCPSCGGWDKPIVEELGWCISCIREHRPNINLCVDCYKILSGSYREICSSCKFKRWLSRNADAIEDYLETGINYTQAKLRVLEDVRPNCLSCGAVIKGGRQNSTYFCTRTKECRNWSYRYGILRHAHYRNGLTRQEALEQVKREIALAHRAEQVEREAS